MFKNPDTPLAVFLRTIGDLIGLNLLFLLCCIPVITIGPALSAMYAVLFHQNRGETVPVIRTFFKNFRDNFLQALVFELIMVFLGVIAWADITFALTFEGNLRTVFIVVGAIVGSLAMIIWTLGIAQQSIYQNTIKNYLINSFKLAVCAPIQLVLTWVVWLAPVALIIFAPQVAINIGAFYIMMGASLPAFITSKILQTVFNKCE